MQVIQMIDDGYRLPPPPGLTKELYKIMIQCWYILGFISRLSFLLLRELFHYCTGIQIAPVVPPSLS